MNGISVYWYCSCLDRTDYVGRFLSAGMKMNEDCHAECGTWHTSRLNLFAFYFFIFYFLVQNLQPR